MHPDRAMRTADGFVGVRGARLEYRLVAGTGPVTLVLLHEGLGCLDLWRDFPDRLADATGMPVLAYSRRGYGRSDAVPVPRSPQYMHDEALRTLPALLDHFDLRRFVLVGHSDGASIALIHAGEGLRPGLAGVVAMAPHVFVEACTVEAIAAAARAYRETGLRDRLARYHSARVDGAFWGWNQIWLSREFADWNIEACLPRIDVPLLVVQGDDDPYGTLAQVDAIEAGCARTRRLVLERCGHAPQRDRAEATLSAISAFCTSVACA